MQSSFIDQFPEESISQNIRILSENCFQTLRWFPWLIFILLIGPLREHFPVFFQTRIGGKLEKRYRTQFILHSGAVVAIYHRACFINVIPGNRSTHLDLAITYQFYGLKSLRKQAGIVRKRDEGPERSLMEVQAFNTHDNLISRGASRRGVASPIFRVSFWTSLTGPRLCLRYPHSAVISVWLLDWFSSIHYWFFKCKITLRNFLSEWVPLHSFVFLIYTF